MGVFRVLSVHEVKGPNRGNYVDYCHRILVVFLELQRFGIFLKLFKGSKHRLEEFLSASLQTPKFVSFVKTFLLFPCLFF